MTDPQEGAKLAPPIDYANLSSTPITTHSQSHSHETEHTAGDADKAAVVDLVTGQGSHGANTAGTVGVDMPAEVVDSPAPASAHPEPASAPPPAPKDDEPIAVDTAKTSTALSSADKAPLPTAEPAPPAAESVSSADAAPRPAVEAAPVQHDAAPQRAVAHEAKAVDLAAKGHTSGGSETSAVVTNSSVARPPTRTDVPLEGMRETGHVESAPPATSKPIVPSAESHLAEHPATSTDAEHVLPLGSDVHPVHQAAALAEAPDHLVNAQVEKHKADRREVFGEEPQGTIVPGLEDDKLWAMIRRFDVQISHTLTPPTKLPRGEPDLRPSTLPAVPFNSDTLKSNLMRVYATLGIWTIYGAREVMRLMSWSPENRRRTTVWCVAYFVCAALRMVLPAFFVLLATLIAYPPSRKYLFPPIPPPPGQPPSATDPTNQRGDESMIAGVGHPIEHRSRAEQVEQQAWEFTNLVQRFGARVVVGGKAGGKQGNAEVGMKQHVSSEDEDEESELDEEEQELHRVAEEEGLGVAADKERREKNLSDKERRKQKAKEAKIKRDAAIGNAAKQAQDILGNIADLAEVFANALAPPKPYPPYKAREKLAYQVLAPIALVFAVVPAKVWSMAASFGFGIAFFGQPLLIRAFELLQEKVPDWQEKIDLRNTLFSGVPTNAQLVLHVIRVAERAYTPFPLPPPAPTAEHMKEAVQSGGFDADEMGADGYSAEDSEQHSVEAGALANKESDGGSEKSGGSAVDKVANHSKHKIVGAFKKVAKKAAVFRGDVHVEGESSAKQKVGNKIDRMLYQSRAKDDMTPTSFPAKFNGTSGHIIVKHSPSQATSTVSFIPLKASFSHPTFERPIEDIVEMKKHGVWIGRTALGWAASINLQGMGLDIRFKTLEERYAEKAHGGLGEGDKPHQEVTHGETMTFSHVARRDELFRRLLAISNARWEVL
ncbi:hypothetical protein NBRC10512_005278 [Rhodotorula toruloides]|uniref:RHTO0S23e01288g1_1 n=2 Tax=Rhodotorula toruloides TaxID=5286 RepID=A0A061BIE7_RHOTO|nr:uncharacterized protein RHTO_05892 [Rhodotorula toruloides NP11]EMS18495.1 hypothetical protein RHTO_05892 [Rhodotorula toruloides NP11]CDR49131.1 RHTO0S23e01288g1_1 [Rhodotorula toruloides]